MPYTYTVGADTTVDNMRLLIPDVPDHTKTPQAIFQDGELTRIFELESELKLAVALACEVVATDKAKTAISRSLAGEFSENKINIPKYFLQRAAMFRKQVGAEPIEEIDSVSYEVNEFGEDDSVYVGDTEDCE